MVPETQFFDDATQCDDLKNRSECKSVSPVEISVVPNSPADHLDEQKKRIQNRSFLRPVAHQPVKPKDKVTKLTRKKSKKSIVSVTDKTENDDDSMDWKMLIGTDVVNPVTPLIAAVSDVENKKINKEPMISSAKSLSPWKQRVKTTKRQAGKGYSPQKKISRRHSGDNFDEKIKNAKKKIFSRDAIDIEDPDSDKEEGVENISDEFLEEILSQLDTKPQIMKRNAESEKSHTKLNNVNDNPHKTEICEADMENVDEEELLSDILKELHTNKDVKTKQKISKNNISANVITAQISNETMQGDSSNIDNKSVQQEQPMDIDICDKVQSHSRGSCNLDTGDKNQFSTKSKLVEENCHFSEFRENQQSQGTSSEEGQNSQVTTSSGNAEESQRSANEADAMAAMFGNDESWMEDYKLDEDLKCLTPFKKRPDR